jgi:hypothetical protein
MITGVRVAGRNDQVAGTKGSDVRTNGECVGTRYGVIYIGSEGNDGKPSEFRSLSSGTGLRNGCGKLSEFRSRSSGTGLGERDLTVFPPYGRTHEAISEIPEIAGWYVI